MKYTYFLYMAGTGPWNLFMTVVWLPRSTTLLSTESFTYFTSLHRMRLEIRGVGLEVPGFFFPQRQTHRELTFHLSWSYRFIGLDQMLFSSQQRLNSFMWNIGLDCQGAFVCVVFSLPMASFFGILLFIVRQGVSLCTLRLELYYISITLYVCVCLYSPKIAPLLCWDPSGQTIAQQGAFTPICHRLSPFVRPDKQNVGPRFPPVWPQSHMGSAALLFSWLYFSGIPFPFSWIIRLCMLAGADMCPK